MAKLSIEELLKQLNDELGKLGLVVCIVKKPREYNYSLDDFSERYGDTNVKRRREELGLTVNQLARAMGVDRNVVVRMETKNHRHTKASLQRFADFFECTIWDLLDSGEF